MTLPYERVCAMNRVNDLCNNWRDMTKKELGEFIYRIGRHYPAQYQIDELVAKDKTGILKEINNFPKPDTKPKHKLGTRKIINGVPCVYVKAGRRKTNARQKTNS